MIVLRSEVVVPERIVHAVLDTNTVLHFKRADQIDWLTLLKCTQAVIHITPVLVRELEKNKVHNKSTKLRERADDTIRWLADRSREATPIKIRPSVELLFIRYSPVIDYVLHRLSHAISDDEFIAHAIEYRAETNADIVIVTNDFGLSLKAPAHHIPAVALNPADKLADEPDETQKEITLLKKRLAQLQARSPQLVLTFRDGKSHAVITIPKIFIHAPSSFPRMYLPDHYEDFAKEMERAERRVDYELKLHKFHTESSSYIPIRLTLENKGNAPATDIHIDFKIPEIVTPYSEYPEYPNPPREPDEPSTSSMPSNDPPKRIKQRKKGPQPTVDSDFNEVSYRLTSLVQHRCEYLETFYLKYLDLKKIENFAMSARMTCIDIPEIVHSELHIALNFEGFSRDLPWYSELHRRKQLAGRF
jgi:rRNA-processing protein FCF1